MRREILAGNWKMYKTPDETRAFFKEFLTTGGLDRESSGLELVVFPPAYNLPAALEMTGKNAIRIGAQNCHFANEGAYTGELSPAALKKMGVHFVLIGHSERREHFFESDELIGKKVRAALDVGLVPMLCVGEKLSARESGDTLNVVNKQLDAALAAVSREEDVVIAYEPVWAIGTGKVATPEQAQEVHAAIRKKLSGRDVTILYGGSVKPENIASLSQMSDIDGFLVGGASLKAGDFSAMAAKF